MFKVGDKIMVVVDNVYVSATLIEIYDVLDVYQIKLDKPLNTCFGPVSFLIRSIGGLIPYNRIISKVGELYV
jgi:hypothetical protein